MASSSEEKGLDQTQTQCSHDSRVKNRSGLSFIGFRSGELERSNNQAKERRSR